MKKPLTIVVFVSLVGSLLLVAEPAAADIDCPDYYFVGARGTDPEWFESQFFMGPETFEVFDSMATRVEGPEEEDFEYQEGDDQFILDDGVVVEPVPLLYEASSDLFYSAAGRYVRDGYADSVDEGGEMLEDIFEEELYACPDADFILVGFSQGADALAAGIYELSGPQKAHIAVVGLMGDTKFNGRDTVANEGTFVPYLSGVVASRPIWATVLPAAPVFSYCRNGDVACNSRNDGTIGPYIATRTFDAIHIRNWACSHANDCNNWIYEHEQYDDDNETIKLATNIQNALGIECIPTSQGSSATLSGPTRVRVGQPVSYSGKGSLTNGCLNTHWGWGIQAPVAAIAAHAAMGTISTTTEGATIPASLDYGSLMRDEPEEPEEPAGIEPYLETVFENAGNFTVSLEVETEDGPMHGSVEVEVLPAQTVAPSMPLLTRSITLEDELLLSWTSGGNVSADAYVITDPNGDPIDGVMPIEEEGLDSIENFEFVVPGWEITDPTDYSVIAVNDVGETDSVLVLDAATASYEHRTLSGVTPIGGTLTLTGAATPELEDAEAESLVAPIVPIDGSYEAKLIVPGWETRIDMSEINAELTVEEGDWELVYEFGDDLDADDYPIADSMREGLSDSLFADGLITFTIDDVDFAVRIDGDTESEQLNQFVINTDATVPAGIETDEVDSTFSDGYTELVHDGVYDTLDFPAWDENLDPELYDWTAAVVSDVHTYIGDDEVTNSGSVSLVALEDPTSTGDATVQFILWGGVGGGNYLTMRSFLEDGVISFRVDEGEPNVIELDASSIFAVAIFPEPLEPSFSGIDEVEVNDDEELFWEPLVDWSVSGSGSLQFTAETWPAGIDIESGHLGGVPTEPGTYPFTVTATNNVGVTVREYDLIVRSVDLPVADAVYDHRIMPGGVADDGVLTLSGDVNERLDGIITANVGTPSLVGEYDARFTPVDGDPMTYDMTAADVDFESDGETWEITFAFGEDLDSGDDLVWERMRDGLAEDLLAGGSIAVEIDGTPMKLIVNGLTTTDENNRWIVDPDPTAPVGVDGDEYSGSRIEDILVFVQNGAYNPLLFPASSEVVDPDNYNWSAADISEVHVYLDDQELSFDGVLEVAVAKDPVSTGDETIAVLLTGQIGDGSYLTDRAVLERGTVSFKVNNGDVNAIAFDATSLESEEAFPTPTAPVLPVSTPYEIQRFRDYSYTPTIGWGGDVEPTYEITGALPPGLYISWAMFGPQDIHGYPKYEGEYSYEISATNEVGTTTEEYFFEVTPSLPRAQYDFNLGGGVTRNGNGTLTLLLRNLQEPVYEGNATIEEFMPAVAESGMWTNSLISTSFEPTDLHFYDEFDTEIVVTGDFLVTIRRGGPWEYKGYVQISSTNMTIEDNETATIEEIWGDPVRITFKRGTGEVNELEKSLWPSWELEMEE